jgi:diacylglycerol kinase family enzyme
MEGMRELQVTRVSIHLDKPSPAHTDGELLGNWITDFEYTVFPQAVRVLLP